MRQVSKKQARKNAILSKIKKELQEERPLCPICHRPGYDLCHILNRSTFPQYYTEKWNLFLSIRTVHTRFDTDQEFRSKQRKLFYQVMSNAREEDLGKIRNYFDIWD